MHVACRDGELGERAWIDAKLFAEKLDLLREFDLEGRRQSDEELLSADWLSVEEERWADRASAVCR